MIKLPGLIDIHVHLREPGATHKEDFNSGTAAALAGGITTVLAMPNTQPPLTDGNSFEKANKASKEKARCDYGIYLGASLSNAKDLPRLASRSAGLKLYLDATYGPLLLDDTTSWREHFEQWPRQVPIAAHAERSSLAGLLFVAALYDRSVHICHVSRKEEILMIRAAKEKGYPVTCEVTPHHLFLSTDDIEQIGKGRSEVRPRLATPEDQQALWDNMDVIDCFATDHAPHLLSEKDGDNPPPGFPGIETMLPLLLTAVKEKRLTIEDIITRLHTNPKKIFNLPDQAETFIEIDLDKKYEIQGEVQHTRCGWTPFEGRQVQGKVVRVQLRGQLAFQDGQVLHQPGDGKNIRM